MHLLPRRELRADCDARGSHRRERDGWRRRKDWRSRRKQLDGNRGTVGVGRLDGKWRFDRECGADGRAGSTGVGGSGSGGTTGTTCGGGGGCGGSGAIPDAAVDAPLVCIGPAVSQDPTLRSPAPRPDAAANSCGAWALTDGVCCAQYCSNDNKSEDCSSCGGPGSPQCTVVNSRACSSGRWPEVHCISDNEPVHYSRSTHFGLTYGGACAFGLYGLCTKAFNFTDPTLGKLCATFCKTYPDLCQDPADTTLRGNFAAPDGDYYTQFWPSLPGDNDNYLSCGECFQLVRTNKDGTDYQPGSTGYTPPIVLQVVDSCPCSANSKWCCGSGRDHCGEVSDFKYGCPLPPSPARVPRSTTIRCPMRAFTWISRTSPCRACRPAMPTGRWWMG